MLGLAGHLEVDALEWKKLRAYWVVAAVFLLNIYTNMMALKSTTVETVIVFRSLTTVIVAMCDWRGQPVLREENLETRKHGQGRRAKRLSSTSL